MSEALVIVASTRASQGVREDRTGPVLAGWLESRGWTCDLVVVEDGEPVGAALRGAIAEGRRIVITTGGTGISPDDATPEVTLPLLDRELPGIPEAIRAAGSSHSPRAALSRGLAGIAAGTFVVNLPGSTTGTADGIVVLDPLLSHIISQLDGGDH